MFVKKQSGEMKVVQYNTSHYKTAPSWMNFNPAMAPDVDRTQWKRTLQPQEGMNVVGECTAEYPATINAAAEKEPFLS